MLMKKHVYVYRNFFPGYDLDIGDFYRLTMAVKCFGCPTRTKRVLYERRVVRRETCLLKGEAITKKLFYKELTKLVISMLISSNKFHCVTSRKFCFNTNILCQSQTVSGSNAIRRRQKENCK